MGILNKSRALLPGLLACLALAGCSPSEQPGGATAPSTSGASRSGGGDDSSGQALAESLPYAEIDDQLVYGYFAIPGDMVDPLPAVLLIHDTAGLDDNVRELADRLAGDGYIVLAADLYHGRPSATPEDMRVLGIELAENPDKALDNLRQAINFIRASSGAPAVTVVGFGLGGGWALNSMLQMPDEVDVIVSYYGQVRSNKEVLQGVDVPYLGFFLEEDRAVPADSVRTFEEAMQSLSKDVYIRIFENGSRGFAMPGTETYDPELAAEAWDLMLAFIEQRLRRR